MLQVLIPIVLMIVVAVAVAVVIIEEVEAMVTIEEEEVMTIAAEGVDLVVMMEGEAMNIIVEGVERKFTIAEALAAREAFLSSATGAAVPVVAVNGQTIGNGAPGALTRRVRELYFARTGVNTGLKKA